MDTSLHQSLIGIRGKVSMRTQVLCVIRFVLSGWSSLLVAQLRYGWGENEAIRRFKVLRGGGGCVPANRECCLRQSATSAASSKKLKRPGHSLLLQAWVRVQCRLKAVMSFVNTALMMPRSTLDSRPITS